MKTYGDSAKTKTVTRKKYSRIVKILRGEESSSMENSKFRFWVRAKGFRLGLTDDDSISGTEILYVPASKLTSVSINVTFFLYILLVFYSSLSYINLIFRFFPLMHLAKSG